MKNDFLHFLMGFGIGLMIVALVVAFKMRKR
jgi:hypothetical protein